MRKSYIAALGAILLGSASSVALAQTADQGFTPTNGPYIGLEGGANFLSQISPHGGGADEHSKFDTGYVGLGTVGYGFGNGFRAELEGGYRRNDTDYVRNAPNKAFSGALGMSSLMVNGLYDFNLGIPTFGFTPHVGLGVGYADARFDHAGPYNGHTVSGHSAVFAYQGIAGVDYALSPNLKLNLDYHYLGTDIGHFKTETGATTKTSIADQAVLIGVRYEFNTPPPAPQPMAPVAQAAPITPPPAPVARAPEVQRSFQVFFDFNKAEITEAAARVIQQAANNVKQGNVSHITVTGHTDTVGSAKYNQALSERRAELVKGELVKDGVSSTEVMTVGVGKAGLLVPTADGIREPQNRRAEIVLQ
jgi:OOP family OmpA-OmpF porin